MSATIPIERGTPRTILLAFGDVDTISGAAIELRVWRRSKLEAPFFSKTVVNGGIEITSTTEARAYIDPADTTALPNEPTRLPFEVRITLASGRQPGPYVPERDGQFWVSPIGA